MRRKTELPELLAPAGDFECLIAAVEGGADAVYVGAKQFGARAYAKNFNIEELSRAVIYCHLHGVRLYVTVNTLVYDREMDELLSLCESLSRIGVDAVIIADLGAIAKIRERVPTLELHASTQMSVHNTLGADTAASLGCTRVVLARELSREDIISVTEKCAAEVEVFLHGALCVCHSGQCLFSSLVGGRSGNRGECAQPCRLPYNGGKYPLSLTDLSLAKHIGELIDSGVASLKIEGRMKSPDYVYTVTSIYRRLLDGHRAATSSEERELARAFSRGGFTDGYFTGKHTQPMTGIRSAEDKQNSREVGGRVTKIDKKRCFASVEMCLGTPAKMTLSDGKYSVTVTGEKPVTAENAPLTPDSVKARLSKMGNTYLTLDPEDIELSLGENINLAPSAINALRRSAAERLESKYAVPLSVGKIPETVENRDTGRHLELKNRKNAKPFTTAVFLDTRAVAELLSDGGEALLSEFSAVFLPLFSNECGRTNGVYLPPVITDGELPSVRERLTEVSESGKIKYALVGNIGAISLAREFGLVPVGDFRLNVTNSASAEVYASLGVKELILSPELTLPQARDIGGGVTVYGRLPLMLTERCFIKENFGCERCGTASLTDRRGEKFPMLREHPHRNLILNSRITYMGDKRGELDRAGLKSPHFIFTVERASEIRAAVSAYKHAAPLGGNTQIRRTGRRK